MKIREDAEYIAQNALHQPETARADTAEKLCRKTMESCLKRGYEPVLLTTELSCSPGEAGIFLASVARSHQNSGRSMAFVAGGISGKCRAGDELVVSAAGYIAGLKNTAIFSFGTGDDVCSGVGSYCDGQTKQLRDLPGIDFVQIGVPLTEMNDYGVAMVLIQR